MPDDVQKLLSEYIAEHRAGGEADPLAYLERADEGDRPELAPLIDGYLARSPGRDWDPEAYAGSAAERVADELGALAPAPPGCGRRSCRGSASRRG